MNKTIEKIYHQTPVFIQDLLLTLYSVKLDHERFGSIFRNYQSLLEKTESFTPSEILEYQSIQLHRIVQHAYDTTPYYSELFKSAKLKPSDIKSVADLPKIPVLTKDIVRKNYDALRSRAFKKKDLNTGHTSGTTGTPLHMLYDKNMMGMTYAAMDRQHRWAGVRFKKFGDRTAIIRGNIIVPIPQSKPPYWRINKYHNQLYLSNFHLTQNNLDYYYAAIKKFGAKSIDGYPSSLYVLAKGLLNRGETIPLQSALTSSETLFDFQREAIEKAFCCRIFDYYGAAERVAFSGECEAHQGLHIFPEYGVTEILDPENLPLENGNLGKLCATSLHNYGMPMIRYLTSDQTEIKTNSCSCQRPFPLMENITTKAEDFLKLADGKIISPSVLTHPFKPLNCIDGSQIIQSDTDHLTIKIIPRPDYDTEQGKKLISALKQRLGENMNIEIELVEELPKTKAGKFKWVVSQVDIGL